jgi:rfaE bifunctional protein kinase chain/domain
MAELTRARAAAISSEFRGKQVIVLGDLMLDEFIWGRVRRISPEAPVPIVEVERQTMVLGGAGNVASNLATLGARPIPLGVVGDDQDGERLRHGFRSMGANTDGIIIDRSRPTTRKTRIIAHNQQVVRADHESRAAIGQQIEDRIIEAFRRQIESAAAVVVSDYGKGLLTPRLLAAALTLAHKLGRLVCLDPKSRSFAHYQPVTVITPNHQEALEAAGVLAEGEEGIIEAGRKILESLVCRAVLVTRGERGMTLFTKGGDVHHIRAVAREVYDVTGAGDTVVATLTLALIAGASLLEAAILANHAAGVVVGKIGTATVTRDELLAAIA